MSKCLKQRVGLTKKVGEVGPLSQKKVNHISFPANKISERNFGNKRRIYTLDPKSFH